MSTITSLCIFEKKIVMSSNCCPHLIFKFGDLIEFLCLMIDLIRICDYWIY